MSGRVYYIKEKGKFRKARVHEFPCQPANGYWLVLKNGHSLLCQVEDLVDYDKRILHLTAQRLNYAATLLLRSDGLGYSAYERARAIMFLLSVKQCDDKTVDECLSRAKFVTRKPE